MVAVKERVIEGKEPPKAAGRASVFGGQPLLSCNIYARGGLAPYSHGTRLLGEPGHWRNVLGEKGSKASQATGRNTLLGETGRASKMPAIVLIKATTALAISPNPNMFNPRPNLVEFLRVRVTSPCTLKSLSRQDCKSAEGCRRVDFFGTIT